MNLRKLILAIVKVISIWIFFEKLIPSLISSVLLFYPPYNDAYNIDKQSIMLWIVQLFIYLLISLSLWYFADKISKIICKDETEISLNHSTNEFLEMGMLLLSFYVILIQVPYLISNAIIYFTYVDESLHRTTAHSLSGFIQSIVSIVLAIILIIGRKSTIKFIYRIRTFGA